MKKIVVSILALLVVGGLAFGVVQLTQEQTSQDLYRSALEKAIKSDEAYLSISVSADKIKLDGEAGGSLAQDDYDASWKLRAESEIEGIPLTFSADMLGRESKDTSETYVRYVSVETSDSQNAQNVDDHFAPAIGKWTKIDDEETDEPSNFKTQGPFAALGLAGYFTPVVSLSEKDQEEYLRLLDKYNLYSVEEGVEQVMFRGVATRKVLVNLNKDALVEFDKEATQVLSEDAEFVATDPDLIDQAFGGKDTLQAEVYLSQEEPELRGLNFDINLVQAVTETAFNTQVRTVEVTLLIEADRQFEVDLPEEFITEEELQALLTQ